MVSFSVIVTNILTLEINTVHMLHYDTIPYAVSVASAAPPENHVFEPGFVDRLQRPQRS